MNPLISICVPVYNGEKYLQQCLDSIDIQAYRNFEVLIIDDCSTDDSKDIISKYVKDNNSARFIVNEKNHGLVKNWNKCIELAKGEWIKFMFQDDFMEVDCIEKFVEKINKDKRNCPLIISDRYYIFEEPVNRKEEDYYTNKLPTLSRIDIKTEEDYVTPETIGNEIVKHMSANIIGEPTTVMFRRNIVNSVGYFFDSLDQICDLEFFARIATVHGLIYIPEKLTTFRVHHESTSSVNKAEKYYSLSMLEPLKLAHYFLFDNYYADLRKGLTLFNRLKLKLYFYVRRNVAWQKAQADIKLVNEFEKTTIQFPAMIIVNKNSLFNNILVFLLWFRRRLGIK